MGEIIKGIQALRAAKEGLKSSIGTTGGQQFQGGVDLPDVSQNIYGNNQDFTNDGLSQAGGQSQDQGMQAFAPGPQEEVEAVGMAPVAAVTDQSNPYADSPYDTTEEIADSIGNDEQGPNEEDAIEVKGDSFKPKEESLLGKIADTLLVLRGRQPVFRQRTDQANLKEAMKGFTADPERAVSRVRQINPELAFNMQQKIAANKALVAGREAQAEKTKLALHDRLSNGLSHIMNMPENKRDEAWQKSKHIFNRQAERFGFDAFPDKWDNDIMGTRIASAYPVDKQVDDMALERDRQIDNKRLQENIDVDNRRADADSADKARHRREQERISADKVRENKEPIKGLPLNPEVGYSKSVGGDPETGEHNYVYRYLSDGKFHVYQKTNGKIREMGTVSKQGNSWYIDK